MLAAVLAAAALLPGPAAAGAWTREKGTGVVIATGSFSRGDSAFDENGRPQPVPDYRKFELTNHLEYGLTPWFTGVLRAELRSAVEEAVLKESVAAGSAGARVRLIKAPKWVFSAELTALSGDFDTIGLGEDGDAPGLDSRLLFGYGTSVWSLPVYADVQAAYRWRAEDTPDEARIDLTLGVKPGERWEVIGQAFNVVALEAQDTTGEGYRYHKLQLSLVRRMSERVSLQLGGFGVVAGRNALREYGGLAALWYDF